MIAAGAAAFCTDVRQALLSAWAAAVVGAVATVFAFVCVANAVVAEVGAVAAFTNAES